MTRILIIISVALMLFSCENELKKATNEDKLAEQVNASESEQTIAFKEVNGLLKNDINNPILYLKRAKLFMKHGDLSSAIGDVDRAIIIDSLKPDFYLLKAEFFKQQNKLKESKEALDKCLYVDNGNLAARLELGWLALVARNYKQALDYADAVLKKDVYSAEAYFLKGMIFEDKQDTARAISSYITAIEQENDYYEAYMQVGLLYAKKDSKLAKEYIKNALRIKDKNPVAIYAFAMVCQERGDYNEAIQSYFEILSIKESREPYFNLGFIHQEYLKVYDVAIEHYTNAIRVEPRYIDAYYNRALCYEISDDLKKAEQDLRKALELDPQYTNAALALERVLEQ